jgi:hypothetical protein
MANDRRKYNCNRTLTTNHYTSKAPIINVIPLARISQVLAEFDARYPLPHHSTLPLCFPAEAPRESGMGPGGLAQLSVVVLASA